MSRYAVIDFGSNTIRLCIYALPDVPSDSLTKKDITVLLNYKEMAGISSYVKNGKLSEKGIKKASRILREQRHCSVLQVRALMEVSKRLR